MSRSTNENPSENSSGDGSERSRARTARTPPASATTTGSRGLGGDRRALSTTMGAVLIIGIVVALAATSVVFFVGFGQGTPDDVPSVRASVEFDDGGDGTFSNTNPNDPCGGGDWSGNDKISITFAATDTLKENDFRVRVGSSLGDSIPADMASCAGGSSDLDWATSPADAKAGKTIEVVEPAGENSIQPGDNVMIIWEDPETGDTFIVWQATVPDR